MKKIIFLDIDGTLVDQKRIYKVLDSTILAVNQARKNGHLIVLCTGRTKSNVHPLLIPFHYDASIYGAGTTVCADGQTLFNVCMPTNDLRDMLHDFDTYHFGYTLEGEFASYCDSYCLKQRAMARRHDISQELEDILRSENTHFPMCDFDLNNSPMNKITIFSSSQETLNIFAQKWSNYDCVFHEKKEQDDRYEAEILLKNISKASGIQLILQYFHMDQKDSIAFGDSMNDYEMIQAVHTGVCMGNGAKKLKEIADIVCGPSYEDSIYETFQQLQLID